MPGVTGGRDRRPLVAGLASALVVLVFFGWFVTFGPGQWRGSEPSAMEAMASQPKEHPSQTPTTMASALAPQVSAPPALTSARGLVTEEDALVALKGQSERSASTVNFQGQWVAQLASKYVGIVDPVQVTTSGTHKFLAVDIWNEHRTLAETITDARVLLLDSRTFGTGKSNDGAAYWMTFATDPSFTNADEILAWCSAQFPSLSGTVLNNHCLSTRLAPLP